MTVNGIADIVACCAKLSLIPSGRCLHRRPGGDLTFSRGAVTSAAAARLSSSGPLWIERPHGKFAATNPIQPATRGRPSPIPNHPASVFPPLSFASLPATLLEASGKQKRAHGKWLAADYQRS